MAKYNEEKVNEVLNKIKNLHLKEKGNTSGGDIINLLLELERARGNHMGKRIKALRNEIHMTREDLAKKMKWNVGEMTKVEKGFRACSSETVKELATHLLSTPQWILCGRK